jgi:hypothetical protein
MPLGNIAFLGSGETSLAGGRVYEQLARQIDEPLRIALLETPAGFELNSPQVVGRVADFLKTRLQNFNPQIDVIPARKKGSAFSPDDPEICAPLLRANMIFMGPGSPTYAIRQLSGSLAWDIVRARQRLGAALVFASAATIAVGGYSIPVYEIFKVGMDVHTVPGLNFFADFASPLSFVPHWNNTDGGADVDTSRCFLGVDRFAQWRSLLPDGHPTIGLDEHTGVIIDFNKDEVQVVGASSISLLRAGDSKTYASGTSFPLREIGPLSLADGPSTGIPPSVWEMVNNAPPPAPVIDDVPPADALHLADERQAARERKDWAAADQYRRQIADLGWTLQDTPDGPKLIKT